VGSGLGVCAGVQAASDGFREDVARSCEAGVTPEQIAAADNAPTRASSTWPPTAVVVLAVSALFLVAGLGDSR
jgi:hypothetical protein